MRSLSMASLRVAVSSFLTRSTLLSLISVLGWLTSAGLIAWGRLLQGPSARPRGGAAPTDSCAAPTCRSLPCRRRPNRRPYGALQAILSLFAVQHLFVIRA